MWLIFIALIASEASAADEAAGIPVQAIDSRFQRMDRDRNGFITANEAPRVALARCECGSAPGAAPAAPSWIASRDSDGDGRVSAAEFSSRAPQVQAQLAVSRR